MAPKVRLFVDQPLGREQPVALSREQAHYLFNVMRLGVGDDARLFNGHEGEWAARIVEAGKKRGVLVCEDQTAPQSTPPDVWLLFAPIKKARTDFIVEKAVEMGVARICPVQTDFTNAERIRQDRLQAHAVEAAEQCGATYVPKVETLRRLAETLEGWDKSRRLMFCDEALAGAQTGLSAVQSPSWAVLIGPEGGFSENERSRLSEMDSTVAVSLGPRILRADTAAVAALTLWQVTHGDWA